MLPARIIKVDHKTFLLFLLLCFSFTHWAFFFIESDYYLKKITFIFIILIFVLFFLLIFNVRVPKKNLHLFCLFLYFPLLDLFRFDLFRSLLFLMWMIYCFFIFYWCLSGSNFKIKLRFLTLGISLIFLSFNILGFIITPDNLFFGAREPKTGAVISVDNFFENDFLNHKVSFSGGHMEEESKSLLRKFFVNKR